MARSRKNTRSHRNRKFFGWFKWLLIALLVLGIGFVVTAKPVFNIDLLEKIKREQTTAGSEAILTEVQNLFLFQTVEYVYKTVFPFDFVPAVYDWKALLDKEALHNPLTDREQEYVEVYRFCKEIGINLSSNKFEFVVITAVVRGGFDLKGTVYENPGGYENPEEYIKIDREHKTLYLTLPPPVITSFEIEDPNRETYPYPDLEISPDNWKRLTQFTAEKIEQQVLEDGILDLAKQKGKAFIEKLLIDSGLEKVVFEGGTLQ